HVTGVQTCALPIYGGEEYTVLRQGRPCILGSTFYQKTFTELVQLKGFWRRVGSVDVQFCLGQFLAYPWPDVPFEYLHGLPIGFMDKIADKNEIFTCFERRQG